MPDSKVFNDMIRLKTLLQEIGEANAEAYAYRIDFTTSRATFRTEDDTLYEVAFHKDPQGTMELHFGVMDERGNVDQHTETNAGNMYRVMATVTAIVNKAVDRLMPRGIFVSAAKSDDRRLRLYKRYIATHLSGYEEDTQFSDSMGQYETSALYRKQRAFNTDAIVGFWRKLTSFDWTGVKDKQ